MKNFLPLLIFCIAFSVPVEIFSQEVASCDFQYGTYKSLASMPVKVNSMASGMIDGKIYLTGGYDVDTSFPFPDDVRMRDHMSVYDPETDTWDTTGTPLPVNRSIYGAGNMVMNDKLYVFGGIDWVWLETGAWQVVPNARVDLYDPQSDTWEMKSNLPVPLGGHSVCSLDGKIYVSGGMSSDEVILNTLYSYDPETDQWTELSGMNGERAMHVSVAFDNRIYVIGGLDAYDHPIKSCEVYDPAVDQWLSIAPLPSPGGIATAAACVVDGEIYLFGGASKLNEDRLVSVYRYTPEINTWTRIDNGPLLTEHAVLSIGRKIYIFGGRSNGEVVEENVYAYTLSEIRLDAMIRDTVIDGDEVFVDLSEHFSHIDGGEITYSVCLDDSGILEAAIDGNMLSVTGLTVGEAEVSILAESGEDQMGDAFEVNVVAPTGGNGEPATCEFDYGTYTELSPKPVYSDSPVCGLIGGMFYQTGGINYGNNNNPSLVDFMQIYDPETDSWDTTGARIPVSRTFYGGGDMALEGKLYVVGGADWVYAGGEWQPVPFARVDVYDPQSDTWELKANLPVPIGISGNCTLNGKIYVSGGISTNQMPLNTLYCYDPGIDEWTELSSMKTARAAHTSVALDGRIYVISGGAGENFPYTTTMSCEVYDPELDQWTSIASLPRTNAFGAACVIDGEIYLVGGSGVPTSDPYKYAYKYNPESDAWIQIDDMKTATKGHFIAPIGRTIYIIGSDNDDNPFTQTYTLSDICLDSMCSDTVIEGDAVVMDLSEHFSHVDGGEITYSVCLDDSGILEAAIEGPMLTLTGMATGETAVSILAESGEDQMGDAFRVNVLSTGIDQVFSLPVLLHIYPNPAKGTTTMAYTVQAPGVTRIEIYDMLGKRVAVPLNEFRTTGEYEFQLNTATFSPGIYFCRLHTPEGTATVKLMVEQ